ncbi:lysine-specific demethylase hairless [Calypte anna]|uniref:lysine-specific demethylase hairless n=1 Tax=Calypte anna TaxID=9244 RepID=UPI0011C44B75|nr:lysine-specific demethylase hairless [Calypte anna]
MERAAAPRNGQPKARLGRALQGARGGPAGLRPSWPPWPSTARRATAVPCPSRRQRASAPPAPRQAPRRDGEPPGIPPLPLPLEAKHGPFLLSSLLPPGPRPEPPTDWCLGSYSPAWGQPLYLGVPPRCKAAPAAFDNSSSSGNKEFYPKKEPGFQPPAKEQAPSQLLARRCGGSGEPWVGTGTHGTDFPPERGPGRSSEPKDKLLPYQSLPEDPHPSPPPTDGHFPPALAKPEQPPCCLCATPGCDGCPGVLSPFDPIPGGRFPCPPQQPHQLKKTWLTRHSEQSLPRCKGPRRDGDPESTGEGKRSAKRPHGISDGPRGAGEDAGAAKRGTKTTEHTAVESGGDLEERRMEVGDGDPLNRAGPVPQEPWCLQSLPCTSLPESIPRCCACATRAGGHPEGEEEEEEDPPESTCRLLHFRRFALGDSGELSVDGFSTLGEAEGEQGTSSPQHRTRSSGSSLCLAKYLLGVLGDPFCQAVRRDRDTCPGPPGGVTAWRRGEGAPQLCDICQRGFFNSHWSCTRCGFQLCPDCHRSRQEADGNEGRVRPPECIPGQGHHVASLVPTQFVPTRVLTQLWKLLHEVRAKFGIESHCPCGGGTAEQSLAEPPGAAGTEGLGWGKDRVQVYSGEAEPTQPPAPMAEPTTSRRIKEGRTGRDPPPRGQPWCGGRAPRRGQHRRDSHPPRGGTVQTATLCDLLASTAVKLCLGQDGVRMAFAPVSPALPSDNRLTSILDSIIARVVEKKIQERQAGGELTPPSPPDPPDPPASHCILVPSGLLWLHDPGHASNYKLFQEHWRRGQPVLVSGLQKRLEGRLWGPESFRPPPGEERVLEVVNMRVPESRVRMSSQEFWDGFIASAASPELEKGGGDLLKLETGFGDMELCRVTNLRASLPLPEYCGPAGSLNLATHLRGQRARRWMCPRVCVAYGSRDRNIGTKTLRVESTDSISILVHTAGGLPGRQEILLPGDVDGVDPPLKERLWDAGSRPGALWHIFHPQDATTIRDFLVKECEDQNQEGEATAEPPGRYLDPSLRKRLREERGVRGWTLLQFLGDAVLVPAGAPHQVQTLTSTISVEQRFLSPENIVQLREQSPPPQLGAQLDRVILTAVREAVSVLRGCD